LSRRPETAGEFDERVMRRALALAERAADLGEVPVGAVVTDASGEVVGEAHNRREALADPTAHAEVLALRAAARALGDWRLEGHRLYVTLEPCAMCAGALVLARVSALVYGARDPKGGMAGSLENLVADPRLNHRLEVSEGLLRDESAALLSAFFRARR